MQYRLPDPLFTWAWSGAMLALAEQSEHKSAGGIYLPHKADDLDAVAHFSRLLDDGQERSWLWLFPDLQQAVSLRMCSQQTVDLEMDLIAQTLPTAAPGEREICFICKIDLDWLLPLIPESIREVWVGFHWKRYVQDRNLRVCTDAVLEMEDFKAIATR
ncbi:MAG: hypothetical protein F6K42_18085 [Leptolyngbya sp. SIO1D8]|nr:hypothetical protein [Leptolyngbya sp. SIO1D8]